MHFIAIYKSNEFQFIEKSNQESIFSLPGQYYVFQEIEMTKQYGRHYKDPFIFLNENQKPSKLVINNIEITDIELLFTYNSNFSMTFNLYDKLTETNKKVTRTGLNHTKAFHNELSFIVKTMTEFPENRSWETFDITQENIRLKNEIKNLKAEINKLKAI